VLAYLMSLGQYCLLASREHAQQYWRLCRSESERTFVQLHAKLPFVALVKVAAVQPCTPSPLASKVRAQDQARFMA